MPKAKKPRRVTISLTLPAPLLERVSSMSDEMGLSRSALISLALSEFVRAIDTKETK